MTVLDKNQVFLLVGSYSDGSTSGISVCRFDTVTGDSQILSEAKGILNPSYLTVSPKKEHIYAVNEGTQGGVSAFSFDKEKGIVTFVNSQLTEGSDPCYINIHPEKPFLLSANYSGGNISVFPLDSHGKIEVRSQLFEFNEGENDPTPSHIHTVIFSPDNQYVFATDLGKDKIYTFSILNDIEGNFLKPDTDKTVDLLPGSGPRHLVFHPNGKFLYCLNELSGEVTGFKYEDEIGEAFQYIKSDETEGEFGKGSADIHISPDGKFLYSSNRLKEDGIAIFSIHPDTGELTKVGYQLTGIHPRNFTLSPDGEFLLCANRDSNSIQVFRRNKETGLLQDSEKDIRINKPVCLQWMY